MTKRIAMVSGTAWYLWNFRRNVIKYFVENGWQVDAIAGSDEWSERLSDLPGVRFHHWDVSLDGANPALEMLALSRITRHLRRARPNIVFNNGIKANVYGGLAARWLCFPYVNNISGLGMRIREADRLGRILAKLYVFASARAKALLIQNNADLEFLSSNGLPANIPTVRTMGSGVDLTHFRAEQMPTISPFRFLFVGRLQFDKGVADFVEAARRIHRNNVSIECTVLGDTYHTNSGRIPDALLGAWENEGIVKFVGRRDDIRPFLARCHALVMPSHGGEGMPKVILEAAASGRPTIVSNIDGCRESVVQGKTGFLVPPGDALALASAMQEFCDLPETRLKDMSRAARAHAIAHFSDERICRISLSLAEAGLMPGPS
ncbi:glycosyltransferase family 4 protein [Sulfitobacter aestuariivivens]|uniref:Glycosyltransferase family 4 protein n=1 Tax=Sulfitobacter aestuariivivens TaxID=2766981 RepID=A0A927D7Y5_9RHOB|nr:glycosyltransferase family 4 protein [Sulfitobacter aestuariivivens]MBD3665444.1 glycosyltransferase family 4 protein [Sulfitobacter aestuariivivens]